MSCLVHARRKFEEIVKMAGSDAAAEAADSVAFAARCSHIDAMFRVDAGFDRLGPDERKKMRQEKLKPLMGRRGDEGSTATRADV